jgi:hypothetical protein
LLEILSQFLAQQNTPATTGPLDWPTKEWSTNLDGKLAPGLNQNHKPVLSFMTKLGEVVENTHD